MKKPPPDFVIRGVPRVMEEDAETGWHRRSLFFGPTSCLDELYVHAGMLSGFVSPHPPHCHDHEELHIALSENLEIVDRDADFGVEKTLLVDKGALLYKDARIAHTMRNKASGPADYFHVRWKNASTMFPSEIKNNFYYCPGNRSREFKQSTRDGSETMEIYSGSSRYLPRLRALFTRVFPRGRIPFHRYAHEVLFMFISGVVEILGKKLEAPGFAFIGTRVPHFIVNHGPETAEYYAFELHQEA